MSVPLLVVLAPVGHPPPHGGCGVAAAREEPHEEGSPEAEDGGQAHAKETRALRTEGMRLPRRRCTS